MTPEQERFLLLHQRHAVVKWYWHFSETMLRAYTDKGNTATISKAGLDALVALGHVEMIGAAGVRLLKRNAA